MIFPSYEARKGAQRGDRGRDTAVRTAQEKSGCRPRVGRRERRANGHEVHCGTPHGEYGYPLGGRAFAARFLCRRADAHCSADECEAGRRPASFWIRKMGKRRRAGGDRAVVSHESVGDSRVD